MDADSSITNLFVKARGEIKPDTNIIIIHFTEEDIFRLGPWPVKRNYYALLINQLSGLGVKKIGLEIFLSSRFVTQSVYDNLLKKEIEKSGRVVLSSVAGRINERNDHFFTDSLSYPSPKLLNQDFVTGHLNYILNNEYIIPLILENNNIKEKAFAYQLAGIENEKNAVTVNFISGWNKFRNYSALEFANLIFSKSNELKTFRDKIVLIGISDPQIAPAIRTPFDEQMPGIGLHAFALDNILNSRDINTNYYFISFIVFLLAVSGFVFYSNKDSGKVLTKYFAAGIFITAALFVFTSLFYWKISVSSFLIPFLALIVCDIILHFTEGQSVLKNALDEASLLKKLLASKEEQLIRLQKELDTTEEESSELLEKIKSLKNDIAKLKESENDRAEAKINFNQTTENFFGMVYTSNVMARVAELIRKAAPTDSTILIIGESGTGKELAAKAIHLLSKRKDKNFVAVNCGALTDSLLESELFGHVRGAFTGAVADKQGRFEMADGGTIFLDEIGETSENFQVKMLRVLQSGEIEKIGSEKTNKVDVRVVAATNKELEELVKEKKFREDLFYRLNVIKITLPPLRERKEDINVLVKYFLSKESSGLQLSKSVLQALNDYNWKGNVRELESVIKRAAIFARSEKRNLIRLSDLPDEIVKESRYNFEDLVIDSLRNKKFSHSSITETAKELGNVNRTMISENLRGVVLKTLVENNYDIEKTVLDISCSDEKETQERVNNKVQTFILNIENDLKEANQSAKRQNFDELKRKFSSKYKNLPVKFHPYLDEVIKWKIKNSSE